jgi:hypothetical protein
MKVLFFQFCVFTIFSLGPLFLVAQESFVSAGGDQLSGDGSSISFSLGQLCTDFAVTADASVSEGVHQPFEISQLVGVNDNKEKIACALSSNPVLNNVVLQFEDEISADTYRYTLFNERGQMIDYKKITDQKTLIPMEDQAAGMFLLRVEDQGKKTITFKIIKN